MSLRRKATTERSFNKSAPRAYASLQVTPHPSLVSPSLSFPQRPSSESTIPKLQLSTSSLYHYELVLVLPLSLAAMSCLLHAALFGMQGKGQHFTCAAVTYLLYRDSATSPRCSRFAGTSTHILRLVIFAMSAVVLCLSVSRLTFILVRDFPSL